MIAITVAVMSIERFKNCLFGQTVFYLHIENIWLYLSLNIVDGMSKLYVRETLLDLKMFFLSYQQS